MAKEPKDKAADEKKPPSGAKEGKPGKDSAGKEAAGKEAAGRAKAGKAAKEAAAAKEHGERESKDKTPKAAVAAVTPRLQVKYHSEIVPELASKLGRTNKLSLPRLQKIVINMGVGAATQEKKFLETAAEAMGQIAGQKPIITTARKAISAFKLREGLQIGCKVTLRNQRMYEFMDRLISLALPRVRDFRGINRKAFDGHGNYSLGLSEQLVFPELNPDKFLRVQGMNITFVVSNATDDESREMLRMFGMPFQAEATGKGGAA